MAHFLEQRAGMKNEALFDARIDSDQSAVREPVIELQRKSCDPAHAGEAGCYEIRPFGEPRQTGRTKFPVSGQSLPPRPKGRRLCRHLRAVLLNSRGALVLQPLSPNGAGRFVRMSSVLVDHLRKD